MVPGSIIEGTTAHFQPIIDLNTGEVIGAEALARFIEPDGTVRMPAGIVEQIEQDIDDLDAFMLRLFGAVMDNIKPVFARHPRFYVSVNIPPAILGTGRLKPLIESLHLDHYAHRFVCELTERQAITDAGREALAIARAFGVRVAMDDFGTGESGIKQLIGVPIDILKIDKSQVDPLMKDPTADRLLRGVVALASALRVKIVAEGVEKREQAFFLKAAGVDCGQGWLWSKAVPADQLELLIQKGFAQSVRWA